MAVLFNFSLVRQNNAIGLSMRAITMDFITPTHPHHNLFEKSFVEIHELFNSIVITNLYTVYVAIV